MELFHLRLRDTRTTPRVASVPKEQREQDPCSVGNVESQHPWHWCVIGWWVPALVERCCRAGAAGCGGEWGGRAVIEGGCRELHEKTDCELLSNISKNTQKSPFENLSYAPSSLLRHRRVTVKFIARVNSFVLTADETWRSRSLS